MRNLINYMDGEKINEYDAATAQDLKNDALAIKNDMTGLSNQFEKNAVDALQGMVKALQDKGNQLTPKIKMLMQKLAIEFEKKMTDASGGGDGSFGGAGMVKEVNRKTKK